MTNSIIHVSLYLYKNFDKNFVLVTRRSITNKCSRRVTLITVYIPIRLNLARDRIRSISFTLAAVLTAKDDQYWIKEAISRGDTCIVRSMCSCGARAVNPLLSKQ